MKARTPLRRIGKKKLASLKGKPVYSTIEKKSGRCRASNPEATRKRRLRNQKRMRSPEYKAAKAGAMERSGGRCEFTQIVGYNAPNKIDPVEKRCEETGRLQFHEEHYARGRILTSDDGKIYCFAHHRLTEKQKPQKQHRRGF